MSKHEINKCCGKKPVFIAGTELRAGVAVNVYICKKCHTSYEYELTYPLVYFGGDGEETIFEELNSQSVLSFNKDIFKEN